MGRVVVALARKVYRVSRERTPGCRDLREVSGSRDRKDPLALKERKGTKAFLGSREIKVSKVPKALQVPVPKVPRAIRVFLELRALRALRETKGRRRPAFKDHKGAKDFRARKV
jgi:hypothetical protein